MERLTSLESDRNSGDIRIRPNPAGEFFICSIPASTGTGQIRLLNASGMVVGEQEVTKDQEVVSIAHLSPGMYMLQYISGTQMKHLKLLKE
jgi:hypothetical protein